MANIRNHCSWVHSDDRAQATSKAKDLIRMAVARAATLQPLHMMTVDVRQSALVVGGGPAGMHAALTIADLGFPVHLVEEDPQLGGRLRNIHFAIDLDAEAPPPDPQITLQHLITTVQTHPGITLHLDSTIAESKGFIGNFQTTLCSSDGQKHTIEHGVTLLAPGGVEYRSEVYGYGHSPAVRTQQEFETLLAEQAGLRRPTGDDAFSLDNIQQVTMIQCIGPAEKVCARTCCIDALKNALQMKKQNPEAQVTILYQDIRTYGLYEQLYQQALAQGVIFVRYTLKEKPQVSLIDQKPIIDIIDPVLQVPLRLRPDLLVLSMPLVPSESNRALASVFKVPIDQDGWFLEAHVKLRPVEFSSEGIYIAGVAHYPKLLSESIVQAQAAASRAATVLTKDQRQTGGAIAHVQTEKCIGCLTCVRLCPFGAARIDNNLIGVGRLGGAAVIEASLCQGCGTCVGACPAEAIELEHYRHHQIESEIFAGLQPAWGAENRVGGL